MAPPPEYDKEPKAPDKSATNIPSEESKALYNLVNEQQNNPETKTANSSANAEVENNKHVEALDDGQLRALLDEAITYKCPKDREGKSNLFKELLESVEQDEQACKAAARGAGRARRAGGRARPALPHSNSLQDLVAALAAEPAPRRRAHAPAPAPVSARAIHGGSLPSGVDTSFLLSEEPVRAPGGAEYVATVRCVNPSPLAERRVSASDAHDTDPLRRSKPAFPMTYTARATLEIGSGGVGSGRAVTSTTASHQVRTLPAGKPRGRRPHAQKTPRPHPPAKRYAESEDERARREYRKRVGELIPPDTSHNPTNIRSMTIAPPASPDVRDLNRDKTSQDKHYKKTRNKTTKTNVNVTKTSTVSDNVYPTKTYHQSVDKNKSSSHNPKKLNSNNNIPPKTNTEDRKSKKVAENKIITVTANKSKAPEETELVEMSSLKGPSTNTEKAKDFSLFIANQQRLLQAIENNNKTELVNETKTIYVKPPLNNNSSESIGTTKEAEKETEKPVEIEILQAKENNNNTKTGVDSKTKPIDVEPPINENRPKSKDTIKEITKLKKETEKSPVEVEILQAKENNKNTKTGVDNKTKPIDVKPPINENRSKSKDTIKEITKETEKSPVEIEILQAIENNNNTKIGVDTKTKPIDVKPPINENLPESKDATMEVKKESEKSPVEIEILQAIENNNGTETVLNIETKPIGVKPPINENISKNIGTSKENKNESDKPPFEIEIPIDAVSMMDCTPDEEIENKGTKVLKIRGATGLKVSSEKSEGPSNASILLTLYKRLLASPCNVDAAVVDLKSVVEPRPRGAPDAAQGRPPRKKKDKITSRLSRKPQEVSNMKKDIIRNALTKLFLDNVTQSDCTKISDKAGAASVEVDSAIPFSCITTPEVVGAAAPAPVDLKPLQLGSEYRAVASLAGGAPRRLDANHANQIPRNTLTSGFSAHGVPLSRPGATFGAAAAAAAEEFKKSLDENGNSLQGFSSPQSGSSQQKKQRRKKSSKNETVIKSHQIDGYQGNKDLNEVLRFIESAEPERGAKRHEDKKKRSAERRKDKAPRASSLDDLSRAAAAPPARPAARPAPAKPERRSWGDDARAYFRDPEPDALELTDFQTVTKKRRPRRRADEPAARRAPDPPSPPSPRARSDRSNDSNDDLDSVHSLPALPARAPPPAPLASYADIARTRHNIPDLIESCNYYGEGEEPREEPGPAAPGDADAYPALDARARRTRDAKQPPPGAPRRPTKERASPVAPDVVADRRPPVVLRDAACARDMDGVTFGFDVNEQLLRGRRCDLLRYLPPAPPPDTAHLLQIIDYVGSAWEDVVRCGGGKVRYFSE